MAYRPSAGRNQKAATAPQAPDLVPIMNLFLAIIPFLMLMLVISQVALIALNFTSTGGGGGGSTGGAGGGQDIKKVQVIITNENDPARKLFVGFEIREPGVETIQIPAVNGEFDYVALNSAIKGVKSRNPQLVDINVLVYPQVLYGTLIKTIDLCKNNSFPNVHYEVPKVEYFAGG